MRLKQIITDKRRIESLDVLRGIAILFVLLTHYHIIDFKQTGVDLFFVLSGFLITKSLLNNRGKLFLPFLIKRTTKIIPSYYFFLLLGFVLAKVFIEDISRENIPLLSEWKEYFFFYRNYGGPPPRWTFEHVWSLCVEEHFYLSILFFVLLIKKLKNVIGVFIYTAWTVIALGIAFKVQAMITYFAEWPTYTHNRIDAFAWGVLLFLMLHKKRINAMVDNKVILLAGILLLAAFVYIDTYEHHLILRIVSPIGWTLIILGMYHRKTPFSYIFKVFAYYSYSIYLWHFLFIIPVEYYVGSGYKGLLINLLLTIIFSIITTHLIEENSMKLRTFLLKLIRYN